MKGSYSLSVILLLSFAGSANAQRIVPRGANRKNEKTAIASRFKLNQFEGKWQEVKRVNEHKKELDFKDTALLYFTEAGTKVETSTTTEMKKKGMRLKGEVLLEEDDLLIVAADEYTIKSVGNDEMVLEGEDNNDHFFKKVEIFGTETIAKNVAAEEAINAADKEKAAANKIVVNIHSLVGNWSVYKREAKPGVITASSMLIKYLDIKSKTSDSTLQGNITVFKSGKSEILPCAVALRGSDIHIEAGSKTFNLPVCLADGKELILGNSGLKYYLKLLDFNCPFSITICAVLHNSA
ncbi:MAG: hypothetical protein HY305_01795 [Sphingobacteriales bacterium]|nr:hypothetical protein [Sphingobacteriales bacterium]